MFNELLESAGHKKKTTKSWAVIMSGAFQTISLIVLILVPLIYTQALPKVVLGTVFLAPPPPPRSRPAGDRDLRNAARPARLLDHSVIHEPIRIPPEVGMINEEALPPESPTAMVGGVVGGDLLQTLAAEPIAAPAPTPATPLSNPKRIKQGGQVQAAKISFQSNPIYPALARQAGIQGNVILHAVIDRDGRVSELEVISGHPLLVKAAFAAVQQWRYQPTLLNNEAVEVETTITVAFVLGG